MIVECPNCKSTFKVDLTTAQKNLFKFKCSICGNIWNNKHKMEEHKVISDTDKNRPIRYILFLNLFIITLALLVLLIYKDKLHYSDEFWSDFYGFFINLVPIK